MLLLTTRPYTSYHLVITFKLFVLPVQYNNRIKKLYFDVLPGNIARLLQKQHMG